MSADTWKVWFKEIDVILTERWHQKISPENILALAAELTENVSRLREELGLLPPMYHCPACRTSHRQKTPGIQGGGVIFAAKRLGLIGDDEQKELQNALKRYSQQRRRRDHANTQKGTLRLLDNATKTAEKISRL